ncbi:hypothetical protein N7537_009969 [Penicillium hordei]|uniref:BTB domain-containing protein n=1 Tax=Penicillium hordei TaxID=40994 RepID=A0AAD6DUE8_9EURO|nr:uncharacterized protein N7537_009969 [Penicillium hordei]KAJ5593065.1 hypothetical protein N7537_009969 [Penicillium hordei]
MLISLLLLFILFVLPNFKSILSISKASEDRNQDHKPTLTASMATDMYPPYQVDPDGDIILFTPEASLIDINKGNVPGNYARFQVSSKHLTLASGYFKRMLKNCWAEGDALSTKGFAEIPVHDFKPAILLIILNLIHGRSRQVPQKLSLQKLTDIAVATDFFQCHEAIEMFAGIWIKDLEPLFSSKFSEDTKRWMMIAWVFKSNSILQNTEEIAMQQGTGPFEAGNLPIPKSIKDKIDEVRQQHMELLQAMTGERIEILLNSRTSCCGPVCDATCLGLILHRLTEHRVSYSVSVLSRPYEPYTPFVAVSFGDLSPTSIDSMVKTWKLNLPSCGQNYGCKNKTSPFGDGATHKAQNLPTLQQDSEISV